MNIRSVIDRIIQMLKYPIRVLYHLARIRKLKNMSGTVLLMLHDINNETRNLYSLSPGILEKNIKILLAAGFTFVKVSEIVDEMKTGTLKDGKRIAFTCDDGYQGLYTNGYGLFQKYGIYPTLYLTTEFLNNFSWFSYAKKIPSIISESEAITCNGFRRDFLTDDQVIELIRYGVEIGSHSVYHTHLTEIPDELLQEEIMQSKQRLEKRYNLEISSFAYPFGDFNKKVRDCAGTQYVSCVTVNSAKVLPQGNLLEIPRVNMDRDEMSFVHSLYGVLQNN